MAIEFDVLSNSRALRVGISMSALIAGLAVYASPARAAAPGKERITVGIQPASASRGDKRPNFSYTADGGSRVQDHVALSNYTHQPVTVSLYATDGFTTTSGGFDLIPRAQRAKDLGTWIRMDRSTVTIPPRGNVIVGFALRIPRNASAGDHAAGVVLSLLGSTRNAKGQVVRIEQRVAARVYLRVSGALHPQLAITTMKAKYRGTLNPLGGGDVTVTYAVTNFGNLRIGAHERLVIGGLGASTESELRDIPELTPGDSIQMTARVKNVFPTGKLKAKLMLSGIRKENSIDPLMPALQRSVGFAAIPVPLGISLVVMSGLLALAVARMRGAAAKAGLHRRRAARAAMAPSRRKVGAGVR